MSKFPKEFWLDMNTEWFHKTHPTYLTQPPHQHEIVHVVEHSAYLAEAQAHIQTAGILQTEIAALRKERDELIEKCIQYKDGLEHVSYKMGTEYVKLEKERDEYREALESFLLGHEHQPNLKHTRALGASYGWCDICSTKVNWGPDIAEAVLAKYKEEP